jgi:hypothetical protein
VFALFMIANGTFQIVIKDHGMMKKILIKESVLSYWLA